MNDDQLISLLSNMDDDLIEAEMNNLMNGVEWDMDSIKEKACRKLTQHNKRIRLKKRLPYAAAACIGLISINLVYGDEISSAIKRFFNQTPVYSSMVQGDAYYLKDRLVLDNNLAVESFIAAEGRQEMVLTSSLNGDALLNMKIVPKDDPKTQYVIGGYSQEGDQYSFIFANGAKNDYTLKPFKSFDMIIGDKTYSITLDTAKSFNMTQKLVESKTITPIDLVDVGAETTDKDGKYAIRLITAFKDPDMTLDRLGMPVSSSVESMYENQDNDGIVGSSSSSETKPLYATDSDGTRYELKAPADAKITPITTFVTSAPRDTKLTVALPALLATYKKTVDQFELSIPASGEKNIDRTIDLYAQKAVLKNIKRLSPTSAELTFQLNTGTEKNVSIHCFDIYSKAIKKCTSKFDKNTATVILEFEKTVNTLDFSVSWPSFVMNGNWTINLE